VLTILLSAIFAGIVAVFVTVAIEKWGGIIGGILGTLPTTIIPATIGIYAEAGEDDLATSMSLIPFGMLLNALFVGSWVVYPRIKPKATLGQMITVSLGFWLILAVILTSTFEILLQHFSELNIGIAGLLLLLGLLLQPFRCCLGLLQPGLNGVETLRPSVTLRAPFRLGEQHRQGQREGVCGLQQLLHRSPGLLDGRCPTGCAQFLFFLDLLFHALALQEVVEVLLCRIQFRRGLPHRVIQGFHPLTDVVPLTSQLAMLLGQPLPLLCKRVQAGLELGRLLLVVRLVLPDSHSLVVPFAATGPQDPAWTGVLHAVGRASGVLGGHLAVPVARCP